MRARYKVVLALLLILIVSLSLFNLEKRTRKGSKQHQFHRLVLSHRNVLVQPPTNKLYAYVLYATSEIYLCNSVINAHRLATLNVRKTADIVVLYNQVWDYVKIDAVENMFKRLKALQVRIC